MDGGTGRGRLQESDAATATNAAETATPKTRHPGTEEVQHLLSRGQPDPIAIADVIHRSPAAKAEIVAFLHQTLGNAFVLGVMAAARPPGTPNTMRVTASALHVRSTPDKTRPDNIIGLLPHHTMVKTTDHHGDWVGIDHEGKPAFVFAQYVEPLPKPAPESEAKTNAKPGPAPSDVPAPAHKDATPAPAATPAPSVTPAVSEAPAPSVTPAPIATLAPIAAPTPVALPAPVMAPLPVASAGPIHSATPLLSTGTLDALRAAVATKSPDESLAAYHKLSASDRTQLRAEVVLVGALLGILDGPNALSVLDELKLARPAALQVAAQVRGADFAFLGQVLHHLHIDSISTVTAAANDLLANPSYLPLLDHIINAKGVTGKQQLALAKSSNGIALLERIYPGLSPLAVMPALGADPAAQRDGYISSGAFGDWLFTDPGAIEAEIKLGTDGADWGRAMFGGRHQMILLGWIASDPAYWGNAFGTALLKPEGDDAAALRSLRPLAAAIFNAIAKAQSVEILIQVFVALKLTLPEWINALSEAGRLDMKSLELALDGPNIGPVEHEALAGDDAAIARIRLLTPGKRASQVLTQLPGDPVRFCAAVGRAGQFSKWVTEKVDQLAVEMLSVVNWDAWMMAFQTLNDPLLFLSAAAHPALQEPLRIAMLATGGWSWLLKSVPHPIPTQAHVDVLFKLYKDGSGIALVDKYAMWAALYQTPLKRKGDDVVMPWTNPGEVGEKRWIAVDPSDTAMNLFFQQYGQMPRTHVDTATAVIMCNVYTVKKTRETPAGAGAGAGAAKTKTTEFYTDDDKVMPAPGEIAMGTSYYGYNNTLYMRATDKAGAPDVGINADDFKGKAGEAPGAVNRSKAGLAAPDMTYFQNHATHEVGHAVGERNLKRGSYDVKGNDFAKQYGQWKDGGSGLDYARMLGFSPALDGKRFDIEASVAGRPSRLFTYTGVEVRNFLTGIVEHGLASQKTNKIAVDLGSPDEALDHIRAIGDIGATVLAKTVHTSKGDFPGAGWQFPHGINGEQNTVTMNADGRWQQYNASIFNHRVSSYSTYSVGENFAEMYTARYTNGNVPPAIAGMDIADFFNELTKAEPSELGLAAPTAATAPGATERVTS